MKKKTFSLADVIPEPLTFEDLDGTVYEARTIEDFSTKDYAWYFRMQEQITTYQDAMKLSKDETAITHATDQMEAITNQLFAMVVPGMPAERVAAISVGYKSKFFEWWHQEQETGEKPPLGETEAMTKEAQS